MQGNPVGVTAIFDAETRNGNENFEEAPRYRMTNLLELGIGDQTDYSIIRLEGSPASDLDIIPTPVKFYTPKVDATVYLIGHPWEPGWEGQDEFSNAREQDSSFVLPKRYSIGKVYSTSAGGIPFSKPELKSTVLSAHGASGSGILDQDGNLIGVHYSSSRHGGCSKNANIWINQRHSNLLRNLQPYQEQEFVVHLKAAGIKTESSELTLSCGSERSQKCKVRVSSTGDFDTEMVAGCAVSCSRNSSVRASCKVLGASRNRREVKQMDRYSLRVGEVGKSHRALHRGEYCWETSNCTRSHVVQAPTEIICEYDVK